MNFTYRNRTAFAIPNDIFFLSDMEYCAQMSFQISFGPISWLMVSEIFPLRTRGKGISLAVLTNFASNAIVTFAFSPLKVYICLLPTLFPHYDAHLFLS